MSSPSRIDGTFTGDARPLLQGMLAVQIFLGYEWLMSGLSKVLAGDFVSGLGGQLSDGSKDLSGWYKSFLDSVVIPNSQLFGYLVLAGELVLGGVLIAAAALWLTRWDRLSERGRRTLLLAIVVASVVAIFMNINFHLANGASHPWIIAADPFDEGIDLDSVMPIIQLILGAVSLRFLVALRREARVRTSTVANPVAPAEA